MHSLQPRGAQGRLGVASSPTGPVAEAEEEEEAGEAAALVGPATLPWCAPKAVGPLGQWAGPP